MTYVVYDYNNTYFNNGIFYAGNDFEEAFKTGMDNVHAGSSATSLLVFDDRGNLLGSIPVPKSIHYKPREVKR